MSIFPASVFAQQTPVPATNSLKPIRIEVAESINEGKLTGTIQLTNPNQVQYRDAYYTLRLQGADTTKTSLINGQQTTSFTQGQLINFETSNKFDLDSGGTKNLPFNISFSQALNNGSYKMQISVYTDGDELIGGFAKDINLSGSGGFLSINSCVLVVNKTTYDPIIGPNVAPGQSPTARCVVSNPSGNSVTFFAHSEYAVDSVADKKNNQTYTDKTPITITAQSTKTVNLNLPAIQVPQVYESLTSLQDEKGTTLSPKVAFRWIIGGESSLIRSVNMDKSEYSQGEIARVTVGADPSMDLYWRGGGPTEYIGNPSASSSGFITPSLQGTPLTNPTLNVLVKDGTGLECGKAEKKIDFDPNQNIWPDQVLDISMTRNCTNPTVTAKIFNNGKELASKEIKIPVLISPDQQNSQKTTWMILVILLIISGIIAGAAIYIKKRKSTTPPQKGIKPGNESSSPPTATTHNGLFLALITLGCVYSASAWAGNGSFITVKEVKAATEIGPGSPVSVHYEGISAFRPGQPCPGPVWLVQNPQPQGDDGKGGCVLAIVSGHDETNFTFLDTQDQITFQNNSFQVPLSGQFKGYGCGNSKVGLIVRAYINGSSQGVKINGGTSRAVFDNLGSNGGGSGTDFTQNLTITGPDGTNFCGPQNLKIELIPYIKHAGTVASDKAEDQLYTDADVTGWSNVTYNNRKNCGGGDSCFGVLQKNNITTVSCLACNQTCESTDQCLGNVDGCVQCLPNGSGQNTCQPPPPVCGASCTQASDCARNVNGCTSCEPNPSGTGSVCAAPPACGTGCVKDDQCTGAVKDGCTVCLPKTTGSGSVCSKPPACGVSCEADYQCAGTKDGCSVCAPGADGKKICQEPFDEGACKCDGFNAINLQDPTNSNFQFEAFGKVEGANVNKAAIKSIQFQMTKSTKSNPNTGTVIASSDLLTPQIVSSTSDKVRYKSTWSVTPPAYDPNGVYRVFANIKCDRKFATKSASLNSILGDTYSSDSNQLVQKNINYSPIRLTQANENLELGTLKDGYFTRITETDSCRFMRFEYGQY